MLLKREPDFARCLTEKMLTYATGRRLKINQLYFAAKSTVFLHATRRRRSFAQNGNRLRDLVHLIATSEIFLQK